MASPPDAKKAKLDKSCRDRNDIFSKFHSNKICCERLLESETLLDSKEHGFCLLKVKNCNADEAVRFSEAFCSVSRNVDHRDNRLTFQFVSLFEHGFKAIDSYMKNPEDVPTRKGERLALERLLEFLDNYSDCQKALTVEEKKCEKMTETDWTLKLAHHLLSKLAANQNYTIDNHNRNKPSKCPCCLEPILGAYGDTSIGAEDGWHGCMDILLGIDQVSVTIAKEEELEDLPIGNEASFEIKLGVDLPSFRHQMISETIVFSFLQKKTHPDYDNFLVPTIGIARENVFLYFYDCENDMLLESSPLPIFIQNELCLATVLALWLTINYKYFCSGTPASMKELGYTADFLKHLSCSSDVYQEHVKYGCGSSKSSVGYFKPTLYHYMSYSRGAYKKGGEDNKLGEED